MLNHLFVHTGEVVPHKALARLLSKLVEQFRRTDPERAWRLDLEPLLSGPANLGRLHDPTGLLTDGEHCCPGRDTESDP